jgi:hypothetical protein
MATFSRTDGLQQSYARLLDYLENVRKFFDFLDGRFLFPEHGIQLVPVRSSFLFANSSNFNMGENSDFPFDIWLPPWHGRFYVPVTSSDIPGDELDAKPANMFKAIGFVWTWIGQNDAYVHNAEFPEVWLGVLRIPSNLEGTTIGDVAKNIWRFIRFERQQRGDENGWTSGVLEPNDIGCAIRLPWMVKRIPQPDLGSIYGVQLLVVDALLKKYAEAILVPESVPALGLRMAGTVPGGYPEASAG